MAQLYVLVLLAWMWLAWELAWREASRPWISRVSRRQTSREATMHWELWMSNKLVNIRPDLSRMWGANHLFLGPSFHAWSPASHRSSSHPRRARVSRGRSLTIKTREA